MAAGGSAPELFTSLIGAVVTTNDVGFGTIVGSAVFNVLFVIGLCGWAADKPIKLTWWPLLRDCTYYILGLFLLAIFSNTDQGIVFWEAAVLFSAYICYCLLMSKSETL
jgi:sodium/potassium/calcium exchanger 2